MIVHPEKPLHWAEAFGLSALVHVVFAYFILTAVVDVGAVFDLQEPAAPEVQITSLSIDTQSVFSTEIGSGDTSGRGADTLQPVGAAVVVEAADAGTDAPESTVDESAPTLAPIETLTPVTAADRPDPATASSDPALAEAPATAPAIGPETVSPLRPVTPTIAPAPPTPTQPAAVVAETPTPQSDAVVPTVAATVPQAPIAQTGLVQTPTSETTAEAETKGTPAPAPQPAVQDAVVPDPLAADLIARIRASVGATCMIAIPQQQNGTVSLQVYAADDAAVGPYVDEIFAGLTPRPAQSTVLIDPRQCAALDYIRATVGYPTGPMALGLDAARIDSGTELTGRLSGTGGRNITLLLIDDNGVAQDLGNYLTVGVNTARFAAPLRRAGARRDTRQLLLAIGTATRPVSSSRQNGQLAETYFSALTDEINGRATITIAPFDVR